MAELAALLGAQVIGPVSGPARLPDAVSGLAVDSRLVGPGSLFVALPGERVDGHEHVAGAFAAGAIAALTARPVPGATGPCLIVPDPLPALGRIARDQVDRGLACGLRVVAVTGSQGKTSTKDLLAQVLEAAGPTVAPHGNFNNEVGLPLTVARIGPDTRYLVAEMGARGIGHIAYLCAIAPPEIGIVLNVGTAHLGEFGSVEAIAVAKGELVESLPGTGVAVLNADDPRAWAMGSRTTAVVVGFSVAGPTPGPGVWSSDVRVRADGCATFRLHSSLDSSRPDAEAEVELQVAGRHQVGNALAVAAAALALGLSLTQIGAGLSGARARSRWRMEMHRRPGGGLVVNDAYNANPESMRAALDTLAELGRAAGAATWAVLGDMLELGSGAEEEHRVLGRYVAASGVTRLVVLGEYAEAIAAGAREGAGERAGGPRIDVVAGRDEAVAKVVSALGPSDVVLVKASRGLALETVAEQIGAADPGHRRQRAADERFGSPGRADHRPTGDCA